MSTNDAAPGPVMGTPNDVLEADDRTSRVVPPYTGGLPPLPIDKDPGTVQLSKAPRVAARSPVTVTRPPEPGVPDELIGRRCGGYVIESLIGRGGMGEVYEARNPRVGKRVAVKVIVAEHSRSPANVDRFLQEAKAAAQIDDPNIIDFLDASEFDDGRTYLVMPFVEGCSLEDLCDQLGPIPLDVAATILLQICGGLEAAHRNGIVHRDVKPQNILVGPRQQRQYFVRIVDFGIAKLLDPQLAGKFVTHTRALMGTPGYMAPEQARGDRNVDARADVYAVATVAYRMLTGRRPYMDESLFGLIEKQATNAPFPRPREQYPG
jgi:eukaryotic-like serine/threonine-protein kinase